MKWNRHWLTAGLSAAMAFAFAGEAAAEGCVKITRSNLTSCAIAASFERKAEQAGVDAAEGRVRATEPWFPSSPVVGVTGARRSSSERSAFNWSASLGVELEIAGQRGARREAAAADKQAQGRRVTVAEREIAAETWGTYFDVLAARDRVAVLVRLEAISKRVWEAAAAAAARGTASGVEADVAEASYLRALERRIGASRSEGSARAALAMAVGLEGDRDLVVSGALDPLRIDGHASKANLERPEIQALEAEGRAFAARATSYRRAGFPSPTVSAFVQRDGFDELVVGLGLAFPLPLPQPLGRTFSGEAAENEALARRSRHLASSARRAARAELLQAARSDEAAREATGIFDDQRRARAELTLARVASEVEAGRLGVRDALLAQEALFEVLLAAVEARRARCLASVELARATGFPLEHGEP